MKMTKLIGAALVCCLIASFAWAGLFGGAGSNEKPPKIIWAGKPAVFGLVVYMYCYKWPIHGTFTDILLHYPGRLPHTWAGSQ